MITVDDMKRKMKAMDIRIEKVRFFLSKQTSPISIGAANIRLRQLEAKKADLEQDIINRIFENELEAYENFEFVKQTGPLSERGDR